MSEILADLFIGYPKSISVYPANNTCSESHSFEEVVDSSGGLLEHATSFMRQFCQNELLRVGPLDTAIAAGKCVVEYFPYSGIAYQAVAESVE